MTAGDTPPAKWTMLGIAADIAHLIATGHYRPGARLPTRKALAEHYNTTKTTIGNAMVVLRRRDLVYSVTADRGLYVSDPATRGTGLPTTAAEEDKRATRRVDNTRTCLDTLHAPLAKTDLRCQICRDEHGQHVPWPCLTWDRLTSTLTA